MSKVKKIILGLFTVWPVVYITSVFGYILSHFDTVFSSLNELDNTQMTKMVLTIFTIQFLTIISMFVLLFIFIKNVFKNDRVNQSEKVLWLIVLFFGNMIAMPVYWYLYIWKEPANTVSAKQNL